SFRMMGMTLGQGNAVDGFAEWLLNAFPGAVLKYYPEHLQHMNRGVEIAKLPIHERGPKIEEWEGVCKATRNPLMRMLIPATRKINETECRNHALLRSASVAIACERYRLK